MILAAGRGKRLRPLTDHIPKPLLLVDGETLVGRHMRMLSSAGISNVVINTAWLGWMVASYVGNGNRFGVNATISDEGQAALETGGGIRRALPELGQGPFWLVNADIWTELNPGIIPAPGPDDLASLVLVANPAHHPAGDFALDGDRVVETGSRLTYSGMAILRPELFDGYPNGTFPLAPLLRDAIRAGRVHGWQYDGVWFDIGSAERLAAARHYARNKRHTPPASI